MTPLNASGEAAATGRFAAFAGWCAGLDGWRRWLLACGAGAAAALAMPPVGLFPLLFVAFPILVWLIDGSVRISGAFAVGWWFGFGYFVVGLYWIAHALLIEPDRFAWLIPFAVCGLPAVLGIFTGAAAALQRFVGGRGAGRVVIFAVLWVSVEWMRGHAFTGFPWNLTGYAWTVSAPMLQFTAFAGIYGLSLVTVFAAAAPAALSDPRGSGAASGARRWLTPAAALLLLGAVWTGGALRLSAADIGSVDGVRLRIVQANIPQQLKWDDSQRVANVRRFLEMSALPPDPGEQAPTLVIWPETAVPFFLNAEHEVRAALAAVAPPGGAVVTGAPRLERAGGEARIWNSILAIDPHGEVVASYDKFHLVPFGEYVPFRSVLGLSKITAGTIDFTPGEGPRTIELPGAPRLSPLVCYEVIFPGAVTAADPAPQPAWMLNVTNDGWYGRSAGPHQHFQMARVRAIEEGLPLVRAANTGISAVVDAHGRIVQRLGLLETGNIDSPLPRAIGGRTVYAVAGDWVLLVLLAVAAAIGFGMRVRGSRDRLRAA